jgi:hypothetical protein
MKIKVFMWLILNNKVFTWGILQKKFCWTWLVQLMSASKRINAHIIVKRLNKGTNSKYRGKLPLICFNYDGIGHFANKCPHKKKRNDEGYSKGRQTYKGKRTTKKVFKKNFCTKEDISSSDEDEVSDSETWRVLFMAVEDFDKEDFEEEYEEEIEEAEVDFREELMSAIEVIRREKKKNKKLQEELDKKKYTQELEQMITKLKVQIEEDKRIEEALKE